MATDKIINLDLSPIRKKRIAINGDENNILELNTSDLNITSRLSEAYPKLMKLSASLTEFQNSVSNKDEPTDDDIHNIASEWKRVDNEMRDLVDYIFDADVCAHCATSGSMYDPINGKLRFEWIIDILSDLYEKELKSEFSKTAKRVEKHTGKYVKR